MWVIYAPSPITVAGAIPPLTVVMATSAVGYFKVGQCYTSCDLVAGAIAQIVVLMWWSFILSQTVRAVPRAWGALDPCDISCDIGPVASRMCCIFH